MTDGAVELRPVLRGSLVTIRPGGRDDVPLLHAVLSEESVTRWWGEPDEAEDIATRLAGADSGVLLVIEAGGHEQRGHHRLTIDPAAANERRLAAHMR